MSINPANANNFVILNRYEPKFSHNANTSNEFCPWNAVTWFVRNKSEFHGLPPTISSTRFTFCDIGTGMSYVYEGRNGVDVP